MYRICFILFLFHISLHGFSQSNSKIWARCFGGFEDEVPGDVVYTKDGGIIVASSAISRDGDVPPGKDTTQLSKDIWVFKLNSNGNIVWNKLFGGTGNDIANGIIHTSDKGFLIIGSTNSQDGGFNGLHFDPNMGEGNDRDCLLLKLDSMGELVWAKCYGGYKYEFGYNAVELPGGDFIIIAASGSNDGDVSGHHGPNWVDQEPADCWIFRINPEGTLKWQKSGWRIKS